MSAQRKYNSEELRLLENIGWERMSARLNEELPQRRRKRRAFWWWSLPLVLVGVFAAGIWVDKKMHTVAISATMQEKVAPEPTKQQTEVTSGAVGISSNNVNSATSNKGLSTPALPNMDAHKANVPNHYNEKPTIKFVKGIPPIYQETAPTSASTTPTKEVTPKPVVTPPMAETSVSESAPAAKSSRVTMSEVALLPNITTDALDNNAVMHLNSMEIETKKLRTWRWDAFAGVQSDYLINWGGGFAGLDVTRGIGGKWAVKTGFEIGVQKVDLVNGLTQNKAEFASGYNTENQSTPVGTVVPGSIVVNYTNQDVAALDVLANNNLAPVLLQFDGNETQHILCSADVLIPRDLKNLYVGIPIGLQYQFTPRWSAEAGMSLLWVVPYQQVTQQVFELESNSYRTDSALAQITQTTHLQWVGKTGINFQMSPKISIGARYAYSVNDLKIGLLDWKVLRHSLGLRIGYRF